MGMIIKVTDEDLELVRKFLLNVPSISDLDDDILKNGLYVLDGNDISGFISYESFDAKGVIRYFVFKKMLEDDILEELFLSLKEEASNNGIKSLYCVVNNELIQNLFESLDFHVLENKTLYLDEKPFKLPALNDALVMEHKIMVAI